MSDYSMESLDDLCFRLGFSLQFLVQLRLFGQKRWPVVATDIINVPCHSANKMITFPQVFAVMAQSRLIPEQSELPVIVGAKTFNVVPPTRRRIEQSPALKNGSHC